MGGGEPRNTNSMFDEHITKESTFQGWWQVSAFAITHEQFESSVSNGVGDASTVRQILPHAPVELGNGPGRGEKRGRRKENDANGAAASGDVGTVGILSRTSINLPQIPSCISHQCMVKKATHENPMPLIPYFTSVALDLAKDPMAQSSETHIDKSNEYFLGRAPKTAKISSRKAASDKLGVCYKTVVDDQDLLVATLIHCDRSLMKILIHGAVHTIQEEDLLCVIDGGGMCDETPMPVGLNMTDSPQPNLNVLQATRQQPMLGQRFKEEDAICLQETAASIHSGTTPYRKTSAKLLNSSGSYAMMVRDNNGRLIHIIGDSLNWIQWIQKTNRARLSIVSIGCS